jgi:hypothetical protein
LRQGGSFPQPFEREHSADESVFAPRGIV